MCLRMGLTNLWGVFTWSTVVSLCLCLGCDRGETGTTARQEPAETKQDQGPLRLVVVDDPEFADAILAQWAARAETQLNVRQITAAEMLDESKSLDTDVVIYPSRYLGELVERRLIMPLPKEAISAKDFEWSDILELVRLRETAWGEKTYAVPLGSPIPLLWYRPDLLEAASVDVPRSWPAYIEAAKKLANRESLGAAAGAADRPWSGTLEPLASNSAVDRKSTRLNSSH